MKLVILEEDYLEEHLEITRKMTLVLSNAVHEAKGDQELGSYAYEVLFASQN